MCAPIVHRGPDDEGHFVEPGVALGMRRLSIIDVAGGHQPIFSEDGSVVIVFNGEIYNHRELHAGLERAGHRFTTRSDTETIVHLYEEYGDRVVDHLRGMFTFAIWDRRRRRLLVARDRVGIKPLYYWPHDGGVAFASEVHCFDGLPGFEPAVSREAIAEYLALGYVPDPLCIYEGVHKLPPGHLMVWDEQAGLRVERYWAPFRAEQRMDAQEAITELRRLLAESVRLHLESDVPLGAFLSGGIDSSTVVAEMTRLAAGRVRTFSIGFPDREYNEAPHAATVARELGTEHTELIVRPDADELIERIVAAFDEPFADSSALPTFLVSQLAREHVTVALSGDGGDELFGGYTRYATLLERGELPGPVRGLLSAAARRLPHRTYGRNRLLDLGRSRRGRYASTVAVPLDPREGGVARDDLLLGEPRAFEDTLGRWFDAAAGNGRDFATQMMLVDMQSYLPGDILTKVDRMSMAVSLEARVPLLDHRVVEFAASLPSQLKMRDGDGKWVLRQAIKGLVPDTVLTKPKQGFGVPLERWFRNELRHRVDALGRSTATIYEYVDHRAVERLRGEHLSGRRDHSAMLWRLLVLDLWLEQRGAAVGV